MAHPDDLSQAEPPGQGAPGSGAGAKGERVALALARAGVASRRDAERMIAEGRVALNGRALTTPAVTVGAGDILTLDGKVVAEAEAVRLWRYHKPAGLLTAHKDPKGRPTVFAALPAELGRVISVGRLDLNSEGLLLLTNAGDVARAMELPSTGLVRRYRARAFGRASQDKLDRLKDGVTIDGVAYGPVRAQLEKGGGGSNVWVAVEVAEGKNREVRRVLEHAGLKVNRLIRTGYGPFELAGLAVGAVEEVAPKLIREALAGLIPPERMPKGDRKISRASPARGGGVPARQRGEGGGKSGLVPPQSGRRAGAPPAGEPSREKKTYKTGWARPKVKPVAKRAPAKPKGR